MRDGADVHGEVAEVKTATRNERRVTRRVARKQAESWPACLVAVPESEWPKLRPDDVTMLAVWRSRAYLVQMFSAPPLGAVTVRRLSVNRVTLGSDGRWDQNIPWDDLQRLKHQTGHGDWYAVEVYPPDRHVINVANMRHLWLLAEPLAIGWTR
jgi:hypothetical protein